MCREETKKTKYNIGNFVIPTMMNRIILIALHESSIILLYQLLKFIVSISLSNPKIKMAFIKKNNINMKLGYFFYNKR